MAPKKETAVDAIVFDIDDTLATGISWYKIDDGLDPTGRTKKEHGELYQAFRDGHISYDELRQKVIELWQRTGHANKTYMEQMFRSWDLKNDVAEIIEYLRENYRLCLISGGVDLWVQVVAEKLAIEDWFANTTLQWDDEGNLIGFEYYPDQAQVKVDQFNQFTTENNIDPDRCAAVGNGENDSKLLHRVGEHSIAIEDPDFPDLRILAYTTICSLCELQDIF